MRAALLAVGGLVGSMALAVGAHAQTPATHHSNDVVQLVTGDRVQLTAHGGRLVGARLHGPAGELRVMRMNGRTYAIPGSAAPYLGRSIDRSVFDVAALAKVERNGRIPLRITGNYAAVPGFTATGHTGRTATGYVSSPAAFGRALSGQRPGHAFFGGVTDIALDAPGAEPVVHPDYPQVTLIIKVTDRAGKPAESGDLVLVNVDDATKYNFDIPIVDGEARASVPLGDYSAISEIDDYNTTTDVLNSYFLSTMDYRVAGGNQTLRLDARKTVPVAIRTPRPATMTSAVVDWARDDPHGNGSGYSTSFGGSVNIYVTPNAEPRVGQLHWMKAWTLSGAPTRGLPYTYDATFEQVNGIAANQIERVTDAQVARVDARYYSDGVNRASEFSRLPYYSYPYFFFGLFMPAPSPGHRIEYVVSPRGVPWQGVLAPTLDSDDPFSSIVSDGLRQFPAGSVDRADWLRGPLASGIAAPAGGESPSTFPYFCQACRTGGEMVLFPAQVTDSDPAHGGGVSIPAHGHGSHFRLYENGKLIGNEYDSSGDIFEVPTGAATYRMIDHVLRTQDGFVGSPSSTVDVTFRSSATSGAKAPHGWQCGLSGSCTVLPVLQARIPLPTDLNGVLPIGVSTTAVTVAQASGATPAKITSMKLQLRFTGEKDWHSVPVIPLGRGQFRAVLANPSTMADHSASLRLTATDAAGGKLVETVANAYKVSAG